LASQDVIPASTKAKSLNGFFESLRGDVKIWLSLPSAHESLLRAWTGIIAALYMPLVWHMAVTARACPFPSLRWGEHLLYLPFPPASLEQLLFAVATVFSILFAFGVKNKLIVALPTFLLAYYCCLDLACAMNPIILTVFYLFAFLISEPQENYTRRIIQVAVTSCYAYTGLQKLIARDFVDGYSLQAIFTQYGVIKPFFLSYVLNVAHSHHFWAFLSYATVLFELLLAVTLWLRPTRQWTVIIAALFHLSIYIFFGDTIMLFSAVMWTGLLAFAPGGGEWWGEEDEVWRKIKANQAEAPSVRKPTAFSLRTLAATLTILFIALYPGRALLWFGRDLETVNMIDRLPVSFAMFLSKTRVVKCLIYYQDGSGIWHVEPPPGRFNEILADSQLYSLAHVCLKSHPDAKQCQVRVGFVTNDRWYDTKTLSIVQAPQSRSALTTRRTPLVFVEIAKPSAKTSLKP
jgi:hypothetical protein